MDFIAALGLLFAIEGTFYALLPGHIRNFSKLIGDMPEAAVRIGGVMSLAMGVLLVWLARYYG